MLKQEKLDVIFEADEDLLNVNQSQIVLIKKSQVRISITKNRKFESYCYEFCGRTQIGFYTVRFLHAERDVNPDQNLSFNFLVKIKHTAEFFLKGQNPLKQALNNLFNNGVYNDVILNINNELQLNAHKCILSSRSQKFESMFESEFNESQNKIINISCGKSQLFKKMLNWIYCGEIQFPSDIFDIFELMVMADEYFLIDLKHKCEESMQHKVDESNVLQMLILCEKHSVLSPQIQDKCQSLFVEEFMKVKSQNPNVEQSILAIPGLMTKLFSHIHKKKQNQKRRVTFILEEEEANSQ